MLDRLITAKAANGSSLGRLPGFYSLFANLSAKFLENVKLFVISRVLSFSGMILPFCITG